MYVEILWENKFKSHWIIKIGCIAWLVQDPKVHPSILVKLWQLLDNRIYVVKEFQTLGQIELYHTLKEEVQNHGKKDSFNIHTLKG